jgi:hypothetical protein
VELLADQHDVDAAYSEALDNLRVRKPMEAVKVKSASQEEQMQKDYYVSHSCSGSVAHSLTVLMHLDVCHSGQREVSTIAWFNCSCFSKSLITFLFDIKNQRLARLCPQ